MATTAAVATTSMKAQWLSGSHRSLEWKDVPVPALAEVDVLIRVQA